MAAVDTSLPAEPTGAAAQLAARHSAHHTLRLYGGWFCPFVQRAWITLVEKGIPHQYVEINPYNKEPSFLALNPRGLVPALAVSPSGSPPESRRPLFESTIICEYLDEEYPGDGEFGSGRLLPQDPYEKARARIWIDHVVTRIIPAFYKLLQHTPDKPFTLDQARGELHAHIRSFIEEASPVASGGPWFYGGRFSLVDVALAPWAKRLWLIDHYKQDGTGIPVAGGAGDNEIWMRWRTWADAAVERPSVKDTWSDDEQYLVAYKRYADDTTNSLVGQATRQSGRLP